MPQPAELSPTGIRQSLPVIILGAGAALFTIAIGVLPYALNVSMLDIPPITSWIPSTVDTSRPAVSSVSALANANFMLQRSMLLYLVPACLLAGLLTAVAVIFLRRRLSQTAAPGLRAQLIRGAICLLAVTVLLFLIVVAGFILPVYFLPRLFAA